MHEATQTIATPLTERLGCRYPIISAEIVGRMMADAIAALRTNTAGIGPVQAG
jgi:hypothetical protein